MTNDESSSNVRMIIGVMSGTSVDSIDAALVRVGRASGGYQMEVAGHVEHAWPVALRGRLLAAMAPAVVTTGEICELNVLVAREFAYAVEELLKKARVARERIAVVGSHGQTVCHLPGGGARSKKQEARIGSTLQLGDVSVLATLTGIRVVGNFRAADMAVGGQGAPLVPWVDAMVLTDRRVSRCVQNIGGIANVTWLPARSGRRSGQWSVGSGQNVVAFDTGPGNMVIDALVSMATKGRERFDRDGRMSAAGELDAALFRQLQKHAYLARRPPKSTGREDFGVAFAEKLFRQMKNQKSKIENLIHTATRFTAWSIADAYRRYLPRMPEEVVLCGGGADNPLLVGMLREELGAGVRLRRIDEFGIPNKAKEAASFALLAVATLDGVPGNLPRVTGARRPVILGVVAEPGTFPRSR